MSDLEAELAAIPKMSVSELADRWQALGRGAAPRVPPRVLQRLYAQLQQEQAFGGLSAEALDELGAVAAKAGKGNAPTPPPPRQVMLTAGTRLVREWNGRTISVDVQGESYVWNDQHYGSLTSLVLCSKCRLQVSQEMQRSGERIVTSRFRTPACFASVPWLCR